MRSRADLTGNRGNRPKTGLRRMLVSGLLALGMCWVLAPPLAAATDYDFPLKDRFAATVLGTPTGSRADLPRNLKIREFKIGGLAAGPMPEVFWYEDGLRASLVMQEGPAPLMIAIAGTGAGHNSEKMQGLQKTFAKAGMHVLSLSSPTTMNFILNASARRMPGVAPDDAADLYRVMQAAHAMVRDWVEITDFYVTGYSLGGMHAAFVAYIDETEKAFNFKRALMINPPVDLIASSALLDSMLEDNITGGIDGIPAFFKQVFDSLAETYKVTDKLSFGSDFLYAAYETQKPTDRDLGALIGISFRITSTNIMFVVDVVHQTGIFVPRNLDLTYTSKLGKYLLTSSRFGFTDYFEEFLYPSYVAETPDVTREEVLFRASLYSIEDYLRTSDKIYMMTNADDVILRPEDLTFLEEVFGERGKIYPYGGHCGNMDYPENVAFMIETMTK